MAELRCVSLGGSEAHRDDGQDVDPKHKVFLSHSGKQKDFVKQLCEDLERYDRYPFFDKLQDSLPIGENFPHLIFKAIQQCHVGVVILSDEFFTSKWPMMELVAMVDEAEKRPSSFKIMPVFLYSSLADIADSSEKREQWLSLWDGWAVQNPERVDVEKWKVAVKYLRPINSLEYNGLGEWEFRKVIVDAICRAVPQETRLEDSHIQGRSRICKVIQDKFDLHQEGRVNGILVLGLYGMHGVGKTSICKALWNEFFTEFHGRVCHVEFPSKIEGGIEEELLREVVKRLTDTRRELVGELTKDQLHNKLQRGKLREAVFMALDNLSDASVQQAMYLLDCLPSGSIVLVTAHSKDMLIRVRPYIGETHCLKMPELEVVEAKSVFAKSSNFESKNEIDEQLIMRCIKQCYFRKDDGNSGSHYHPLALDVLGKQLRCIDPNDWGEQLDKIEEVILNSHPIFSIFGKTFHTLSAEDQMLFMDVAFFLPAQAGCCTIFEWLGMVHRSVEDVMRGLERLKSKSMLEMFSETKIGMHDLWRAFCVAEIKSGELGCRRWVYEARRCSELVESSPSGSCWENVKRMALLQCKVERLERVNFAHFSNVTVLKITGFRSSKKFVLDLSGLTHLKSLEVVGAGFDEVPRLVVEGLPRDLIFLSSDRVLNFKSFSSHQSRNEIGCLNNLQCLRLMEHGGSKLPDMRSMVSVREAIFKRCANVVTVTGLSSKLTNLRVLKFSCCRRLRSCPGVGDLIGLEELYFGQCGRLERLPNLRKLRNLRKLDISGCLLINDLSCLGLGELVALKELHARSDWNEPNSTLKVPDMWNLRELQVLDLGGRRLEAVPGFDRLVSLQRVEADFREVACWPNLRLLTALQRLNITGWSIAGLRGLDNLAMLNILDIRGCSGVDELPDFRSLICLETLRIVKCEFKDMSGLRNLSTLIDLRITECEKLERLPEFQRLTRLERLYIRSSPMLRGWNCELGQAGGSVCRLNESSVRFDLPHSPRLCVLRTLALYDCGLVDVTSIGAFSGIETLHCWSLPAIMELPDLSNFSRLEKLSVMNCISLRRLTSREPMSVLSELSLENCSSLATLPDLRNFPRLHRLTLNSCEGITTLSSTEHLRALQELCVRNCSGLEALPDLGMFPAIQVLEADGCSRLLTLSSSVPFTALRWLTARRCRSLSRDDLDRLRALCPEWCIFNYPLDLDVEEPRRSRLWGCFGG